MIIRLAVIMSGEGADLVNSSTALLSMRSSSFDELSAYGEVIDNSIQANASFVKMKFETGQKIFENWFFPMMEMEWILKRCRSVYRLVILADTMTEKELVDLEWE